MLNWRAVWYRQIIGTCGVLLLAGGLGAAGRGERFGDRARLSQFVIDSWNRDNGLPSDILTSVAQTRDGYLWLASRAGIIRFNGMSGVLFDRAQIPRMRTNIVTQVFTDDQGTLWAAPLEPGVIRFDGTQWSYLGAESGVGDSEIAAFHRGQKQKVWAAPFRGGLLEWDGKRFQRLRTPQPLPPSTILRVLTEADGTTWLGTAEHGLIRWRGEAWDVFTRKEGLPADGVWGLHSDGQQGLWVGTRQGIHAVRIEGKRVVATPLPGTRGGAVEFALPLRNGEIWWGMNQGGLVRQKRGDVESFADQSVLKTLRVRAALEDREGSVWIATESGLLRFVKPKILFHAFPEGEQSRYFGKVVLDQSGEVLLTRAPNLVVRGMGPEQEIVARIPDAAENLEIIGRGRNGAIWIRNRPGEVFRLQNGSLTRFSLPIRELWHHYRELRDGRALLVGRDGSLMVHAGEGWKAMEPALPATKSVITLVEETPSGELWVGSRKGLWAQRGGRWQGWKIGQGLPSNLVSALHVNASGEIWVGTAAGIVWMSKSGPRLMDKASGLPSEAITGLAQDSAQNLWVASSGGVFRLPAAQVKDWQTGRRTRLEAELFSRADGLPRSDGQPFTGNHVGPDGRIWFQFLGGVVEVDPLRMHHNDLPPITKLEAVSVDGKPISLQAEIPLSADSKRLEMEFSALSLVEPKRNRYQYRLLGYEDRWNDAGAQRRAVYTGLPGGQFRFEVRGANDGGVMSTEPAVLHLRKEKRFAETAWMPLLLVAGAVLLGFFGVRWRSRQLQQRYELKLIERQRIARELHDGLLQEFTGATLQLAALGLRHPETAIGGEVNSLVDRLEVSLRNSRQSIRDLRGREWEGVSLATALRQCAAEVAPGNRPHCKTEIPDFAEEFRAEAKEVSWQILREALRNAVKHAAAKEIRIRCRVEDAHFVLEVEDDGNGFDLSAVRARNQGLHFGLQGLIERAEEAGGQLTIVTAPGAGCRLEFRLPARLAFAGNSWTRS